MDFFDREARARKQTKWLMGLFGFGVAVAFVFYYVSVAVVVQPYLKGAPIHAMEDFFNIYLVNFLNEFGDVFVRPFTLFKSLWNPYLAGWVAFVTLGSTAGGCYYKFRQLSDGGPAVAEMLGGRQANTTNVNEKKLCDVVEEMAIASGMPVPAVYVLDNERGLNSFAAGHTHDDVAIGVTRGFVVLLSRDEMQGMVAHEFSHVLNGDTRLNMRLIALLHGLIWPTIVGRALMQAVDPINDDETILEQSNAANQQIFLAPFAFVCWFIGAPGLFLSRFIKSAICREREWLADAAAVQFTRNPAGIEGALKKNGGLLKQGRLDTPFAETASHLYFTSSDFDPWFNFTATHPPLAKRIEAIDPTFDGTFQHIMSLPRPEVQAAAGYDKLYQESLQRARDKAKVREEFE
jgi:Zn-dependent protease with chaperone function